MRRYPLFPRYLFFAQVDNAKRIVAAGGSPLTVALLEQRPGNVTTLVLTVPALAPQRRMLH